MWGCDASFWLISAASCASQAENLLQFALRRPLSPSRLHRVVVHQWMELSFSRLKRAPDCEMP